MTKMLPMLALTTVAIGFFGAVGAVDLNLAARETGELRAHAAATGGVVTDDMAAKNQGVDQPFCDAHQVVANHLNHDFAEVPRSSWTQGRDMRLELFASALMGTWTLVHAGQDGISCIVASGFGWTQSVTPQQILKMAEVAGQG